MAQHLEVVVRLDDQIVGLAHIVVDARRYASQVGGDGKRAVVVPDEEAGVVGAVVHGLERRYGEVAYREGYLLVYGHMVVLQTSRYAVAPHDAAQCARCAVQRHVPVFAQQGVDAAHVVAVVVGYAYPFHVLHADAVAPQGVDHGWRVDTGVDEKSALRVADVAAVARGARSRAT